MVLVCRDNSVDLFRTYNQCHGATVHFFADAIPLFALTCEPTTNHDVIMTCAKYTEVYVPRNKIYGGARIMDTCNVGFFCLFFFL